MLCAAVGIAVAGETPDTAAEAGWTKTSRQYFHALEAASRVRVDNPHGNIYVRFGGYENQLEVLATAQRIDRDLPELGVVLEPSESGLELIVAPLDHGDAAPDRETGSARRDRIDLVVFIPRDIALELRTLDDDVEVKGIKSDLVVNTRAGGIRLRKVAGRVVAKSKRGSISVALENGVTRLPQELATETGEIEAYLWEDAAMRVTIATSGRISTDFSLEIEHRRYEEPGKYATAILGDEGPQLKIWSKRGDVRLLRLPREDPR